MKNQFYYILTTCLLLSFSIVCFGQREKSALLPATEAKAVTQQCSRSSPNEFTETWEPTKTDIRLMESRFSAIKKLKAKCCMEGEQIENLDRPYMQYVGIVIKGKKLIYINAFYDSDPGESWKERAYVICDGGTAWGVLYDPKTGKFFDLSVNGVA